MRQACLVAVLLSAASAALAQPGKSVKVMIGSIVPADKPLESADTATSGEPDILRNIGSGPLAGALRRPSRLSVEVFLDSDTQFQVYKLIENEQRRAGRLSPAAVKSLRSERFDYFIFVKYWTVDSAHVRIEASLAKLEDNDRAVYSGGGSAVTRRSDPEFQPLGEQLYDALLKSEGLPVGRRLNLVFCEVQSDAANADVLLIGRTIRDGIVGDMNGRRPWYILGVFERACGDDRARDDAVLIVTGRVQVLGNLILVTIEIRYRDAIVAKHPRSCNLEEIKQKGPEQVISSIAENLRNQVEKWSPPL